MRTHTLFATFTLLLCVFCSAQGIEPSELSVVSGVLDAREFDFSGSAPITLNGEWEFYWAEFAADFSDVRSDISYISVPSSWNGTLVRGGPLSGLGYATYRARVLLPQNMENLALKFLDMGTACAIYVNSVLVYQQGKPGSNAEESMPGYKPGVAILSGSFSELEIVVHVSNFHYRLGGMWEPIQLGSVRVLSDLRHNRLVADAVIFGSILIMGLYHLTLFLTRRERMSILWFGLFCLLISARIMLTGERYITEVLPGLPWAFLPKLEYLSFFLALPAFALYLFTIFADESRRWITLSIVVASLAFSLFVVVAPSRVFTYTLTPFQILTIAAAIYALAVVILALIRKRPGAASILIGFAFLFVTLVNDILYAASVIRSFYAISFGLLFFLFFQAIHIAGVFNRDYHTVRRQSETIQSANEELDEYRNHLESIVAQRTADLETAKTEAEAANLAKSEFLASMSHELRTPLNHIMGFVGLVAEERLGKISDVQSEYLNDTLSSAEHLLNLINDILDIAKVESGTLDPQCAKIELKPLVAEIIKQFRGQASEKHVTIDVNDHAAPEYVWADPKHMRQIMINLITNAIKFSPDGERIVVSVTMYPVASDDSMPMALIGVADAGVGIEPEDQNRIFESFEQVDGGLSRSHGGTGLGLALTKSFVNLHGGRIWVESDGLGKGSTFFFTMPVEERTGAVQAPDLGQKHPE